MPYPSLFLFVWRSLIRLLFLAWLLTTSKLRVKMALQSSITLLLSFISVDLSYSAKIAGFSGAASGSHYFNLKKVMEELVSWGHEVRSIERYLLIIYGAWDEYLPTRHVTYLNSWRLRVRFDVMVRVRVIGSGKVEKLSYWKTSLILKICQPMVWNWIAWKTRPFAHFRFPNYFFD